MEAMHRIGVVLVAAASVTVTTIVSAADYPVRPIRLMVGFPAGGSTDVLSRQVGQALGQALQQQIVVDNRAGATGIVATEITARANPDGYTLMMATVATHAINPALYRKVPFDPVKDFAPVSLVAPTRCCSR